MPESASNAVRNQLGSEPDEQLDHLISLELGGSNDTSNLNNEKVQADGTQPSLKLENQTAKDVASGKISYIEGQKIIARAKGVKLPDDTEFDSSPHPLASAYPNAAPNQTLATKSPSLLDKAASAIKDVAERAITTFGPFQLLAKVNGGESIWNAVKDIYADPNKLTSDDINGIINRRKELIDSGTAPDKATIQATKEAKAGKLKAQLLGSVGPEADLTDLASVVRDIAESKSPTAIADLLSKVPGVAKEEIPTLSKALTGIKDPEAVQSVIDSVSEKPDAPGPKPNISADQAERVGKAAQDSTAKLKGLTDHPVIDTTQEAKLRAEADTMEADMGKKGGIKGFATDIKNATVDWINGRRTSRLTGYADALKFKDLDKGGIETLLKFQSGDRTGRFADVQKYFDTQYKRATDAGIDLGYKKNYLPQLWKNPASEVESVFGKTLSTRPGFSMQSILKDYQEGLDKGLTPRFTKVSDIVQWYGERVEKAISDSEYFNSLASKNLIQPSTEAPRGWKSLNPDTFPSKRVSYETGSGTKTYSGVFKAPPELAKVINNYLSHPETSGELFFKHAADIMGTLKNTSMSFGVPGTGINVHGFNLLVRSLASPEGRLYGLYRGLKYMVNPSSASSFFNETENLAHAQILSKYGMLVSSEEHDLPRAGNSGFGQGLLGRAADKVKSTLYSMFGKNIFEKMVPAIKTQDGWGMAQDLLKQGYSEREAYTTAAKTMNDLYGGINTEVLGRDRTLQNVFRTFAFAPDFMETNYNLGKEAVKAFTNPKSPQAKLYRGFFYTVIGMYTAANAANYKTTGHLMYQNSFGHEMDVAVGKDSQGKTIYVKPFGSAADFIRLPQEAVHIIASGAENTDALIALLRNRLSKGASLALGLLGNSDVFGNPIFGRDQNGKPIPAQTQLLNLTNEAVGTFAPSSVENATGVVTGKQSPLQAGVQAAGLPVGFKNENYDPIQAASDAHSADVDKFRQTFDTIQKLIQDGNKDGAQKILDGLTEDQYSIYKGLKGAQSRSTTKAEENFLPTYRKIQALVAAGNAGEAQKLLDGLAAMDYKTYQSLKNKGVK